MAEEDKCAFCGAPIAEPYFATVGGKRYSFHAKACADAFVARRRGRNMSLAGGALGLIGGVVALYSGLTAHSMSSTSMSSASSGPTWALVVLGAMVLVTGAATVAIPSKVPMEVGSALMSVYGILMLVISITGILSIALVTMNMDTSWAMLVLGAAMLVCGYLMLRMKRGISMSAGPGQAGPAVTTYAIVLALAVVLVVGGLSFYGRIQAPSGPSGMNSTTTTPGGGMTTTTTPGGGISTTTTPGGGQTTTTAPPPTTNQTGPRTHTMALPSEVYPIPAAGYYVINFTIPGDAVNASVQLSFTATGAAMSNDIQVLVFNDANFTLWLKGQSGVPVYSSGEMTSASKALTLPSTGLYHIVLDNTFSLQLSKQVQFSGSFTYWD